VPVVDRHHAEGGEDQEAVDDPGDGSPLHELRQRLDVAGHPGDQRTAPLLVVLGHRQPVDVVEGPHP
jgi:hypothetical protein